jgi:hypothetical protein
MPKYASRISMVMFETNASWYWKSHNPTDVKVLDVLKIAESLNYECFLVGRNDLYRISPWFYPYPGPSFAHSIRNEQELGSSILCIRTDTAY